MSKHVDNYNLILDVCSGIDFPAIENLLFTIDAPVDGASHFMPRLNILLTGSVVFKCVNKNKLCKATLNAPAIYYCSQNGYQVLLTENERSSISFCYQATHIRLVHYQHQTRSVINISLPLPESGKKIIAAAEQLWREGETTICRTLLNELFNLTLKTIKNSTPLHKDANSQLWKNIIGYINSHPGKHISRSWIAQVFGISPGYVSKLARKYHNTDFVTLVNEFKLGQAAMLLSSSELTIPEIAEYTGFKYTSYFFRSFRKYYNMTPKEYREKNSCLTEQQYI